MSQAVSNALNLVFKYAKAHPIGFGSTFVNAIMSLILGPFWLIRVLLSVSGFQLGGVAAGSIAAWWQSVAYGGYVPVGSIFSLAQSLGAVLGA
ncbi:hypothetical protein LTR84_004764 [Exophiala bonariae]|uniref:Major facilitator superfamily (MFS) profile domain-containing protein n=1 Tax=Exophiala bonariae TaxID=1690606 RepID=A0AAV9NRJ8_9EURO|nr:hypothetical protein LTR84_004764 [Exophiala bonariae]